MHLSGSRILKEKKKTKNQNNMSYAQQSNVCKKRLHEQQSLSSSKASKGEQMKSYPFIDTYVIHHILQSLPVPGLWMCATHCQDSKFMSETPLAYSVNTNLIHPWKMEHNPPCIKFSLEKETVIIGQKQIFLTWVLSNGYSPFPSMQKRIHVVLKSKPSSQTHWHQH